MPIDRFYIDEPIQKGDTLEIRDQEFHHLAHVTRAQEGAILEIVNGQGQLGKGKVIKLEKKRATIEIEHVTFKEKPSFEIILVQAIPRINRLDFIIEKGVELGMTQLWLLPAKYSERKLLTEKQLEGIRAQMVSAMKQCGRLYIPSVHLLDSLDECSPLPYPAYFGDLDPQAPLFETFLSDAMGKGIIFFVGPESGFADEEIQTLRDLGAKGVCLHSNILRTDTASLVALSLITHSIKKL